MSEIEPDLDFLRIDKKKFEECPSDSVDFAVMEKLLMQW
jgi:mannose-1-phosphate guanylyltransferase